ncbi:head-tail connector protein [Acinetobacter harbinensis]|uniref:head-tail connector protein n=1 Tax=Acinetobacter harbinensis TaxID=1353941 RepID=UPI001C4EDFD8|nr:head-tail connector protein [Acinetobacter harbinensis]
MSIVSLELIKEHLRYDDDSNDLILQGYLDAAESAVLNYITDKFEGEYPKAIHQAILLLCGYFDQYRNAEQEMPVNGNFLPMPVQSLLYPYRMPTAI